MQKKIRKQFQKILILGSGALKIGEAGEFDYSGSQAIKALKEEGIYTVLINPNIATYQTSAGVADKVYFLPVNPYFIEKIIAEERPDGLLLSFGGQTALNCGLTLEETGVLKKYSVEVLGTPVEAIRKTEDRALFNQEILSIGLKVPKSVACANVAEGIEASKKIGFPIMIRAGFTLGGKGSGFVNNQEELLALLETAFAFSPQVLVEESLRGWKEIEYEVVRDSADNCITVCNMENFDPLGIHTGESIVVAPSQTLTNSEYHMLRTIAQKAIRHFGIIGECNIQYALDPKSEDYRIIEVNARLSRSSALASKATGYPLAFVAAKLALGYNLPDLKNSITRETTACFEPALDYLALKIPRWDLDKFRMVSKQISSEMKSVGEIMAIGRSFEEVIQKGLRMLQIGLYGLVGNEKAGIDKTFREESDEDLKIEIMAPTPKRILAIAEALRRGWATADIYKFSGVDLWFLEKLQNIVKTAHQLEKNKNLDGLRQAKKYGFSDKQIAELVGKTEKEIRDVRHEKGILPVVKKIDTMAAEYPAMTNYLYLTYHGEKNDVDFTASTKKKVMVLGSGPYAIGTSVEFDWCSINALQTAQKAGYETIVVNYNPETVSTDYDLSDKLYFDELSLERVLDIYEYEQATGVIVCVGGQVPTNLALKLHENGVPIFGTKAEDINRAENRHIFSAMCDELEIDQPLWQELSAIQDIQSFAERVGYPVLVRPSYVLSGAAMRVATNEDDLMAFLAKATRISPEAPVVVSKFETDAKEIEVDAVALDGELIIYAIAEHIENAGVHSGDATIVLPPQKLYIETIRRIKKITKQIAAALKITGPFNIQFLAKSNRVMVIECNLRASRSFPFASKVTGYNFIEIATEAMLGLKTLEEFRSHNYKTLDLDHVGVKAPQFSFSRLKGADPVLGVEMASTGEVACFGEDMHEAFLKAMISTGFRIPKKGILVSIGRIRDKVSFMPRARKLVEMGYKLFATRRTSMLLTENGITNEMVHKVSKQNQEGLNIVKLLASGQVDLVINIPNNFSREEITDGYLIRRKAIDSNIPLINNLQVAKMTVESIALYQLDDLKIWDWSKYL